MKEKLALADERLKMSLDASGGVGLWDWMLDSDLLHGDAAFARMYGLDVDRVAAGVIMEEYRTYVVQHDIAPLWGSLRAVFEDGADFDVTCRIAIPGQPLKWVECKGKIIGAT